MQDARTDEKKRRKQKIKEEKQPKKKPAAAPPARLEFPLWIYEEGILDDVLDIVRAEVIAGNGYPYAIETADAAAVITTSDRETFYTLFRHFAETRNLDLQISQKAASKHRRR